MSSSVVSKQMARFFAWEDYTVFAAMLVVSALIGVYHGFSFGNKRKKKEPTEVEDSAGEFLTAGGKMSTLPVALSMLAR